MIPRRFPAAPAAAVTKSLRAVPPAWLAWALLAVLPAASRPADPGTDAQRAAGKALYLEKCSQCHGEAGDGKGPGAEFFRPLPRDFTSGAFKIRTTGSGELPTDEDLKAVIRRGMPHTGMPAWPQFSDAQVADLVYYIKTFNPDFADTANLTAPMERKPAPAFSAGSAARGRKVFEESKCMDCHGRLGRGDGESAPTLEDDWGHRIRPADLTKRWTFRGGPAREDIYRTFMTGLNGTPMPSYASSIEKEEDRWALVDYVHSLSAADKAPYAAVVTAAYSEAPLDLRKGRDLFRDARPALFPVVGQVIEGKRSFFPSADAVEVRALYDSSRVALLLAWHDMAADTAGTNSPLGDSSGTRSDAVAVQLPLSDDGGAAKPYFLFGDPKRPVELLFRDLAGREGVRFLGKGDGALKPEGALEVAAGYADGEWWALFTLPRKAGKGPALEPGTFVPIAFSLWDGTAGETGSARGITSWYSLHLQPGDRPAPAVPAAKAALGALLLEVVLLFALRRRFRKTS
jgi:DMSO reductase family type II enzyme heme b subunit